VEVDAIESADVDLAHPVNFVQAFAGEDGFCVTRSVHRALGLLLPMSRGHTGSDASTVPDAAPQDVRVTSMTRVRPLPVALARLHGLVP
jgi:hypothetical protein